MLRNNAPLFNEDPEAAYARACKNDQVHRDAVREHLARQEFELARQAANKVSGGNFMLVKAEIMFAQKNYADAAHYAERFIRNHRARIAVMQIEDFHRALEISMMSNLHCREYKKAADAASYLDSLLKNRQETEQARCHLK